MILIEERGRFRLKTPLRGVHSSYAEGITKYLDCLSYLFTLAKRKNEFEFIRTILRIRDLDSSWDALKNLKEVTDAVNKVKKVNKFDHQLVLHVHLFAYGLIIESTDLYELMANLLNILDDQNFSVDNFPDDVTDGRPTPVPVWKKIEIIKAKAVTLNVEIPNFYEFVDFRLRNAIFHSEYAIDNSNIQIERGNRIYSREEGHTLINKALAYYEVLVMLSDLHRARYSKPRTVRVARTSSLYFDRELSIKVKLIVRKDRGVIGFRDCFTKAQIRDGRRRSFLASFYPYEREMILRGDTFLPPSRVERANRLLDYFPNFLRAFLVKVLQRYYVNR
ncbi:MAG: hypothetical protein NUV80_00480 [Candidatus Berkelbacteria bacterium]|nr:hypothetical protein [Candidatus Berkelbacteria bacterium]MCR4307022.1 hypothetical protein [Candidatus Berkelbacteria bacterium]